MFVFLIILVFNQAAYTESCPRLTLMDCNSSIRC